MHICVHWLLCVRACDVVIIHDLANQLSPLFELSLVELWQKCLDFLTCVPVVHLMYEGFQIMQVHFGLGVSEISNVLLNCLLEILCIQYNLAALVKFFVIKCCVWNHHDARHL